MSRWSRWFALSLVLVFAALIISCAEDESGPPAEAAAQEALVADDGIEGAEEKPQGDELTLAPGSPLSTDLANAYRETCIDTSRDDLECEVFHRLVVTELAMALETIQRSRDQRGTAVAMDALDLEQEPEILVAAMRILGAFPDTPGIAEKTWPLLLESPYLQVQQMAAHLLASNPDPTLAAVGSYWSGNHSTLYTENAYQEYPDFAPHYADMGFPDRRDAAWFSPADSDRSVGWWSSDDFATVSAWLTVELGTEGLTFQAWAERMSQESMAAMPTIDPDKQAEMNRLIEEWTTTQDMAVLEKLTKLQEELYAPVEAAGRVADELNEKGVFDLGPPNSAEAAEQARYFIAEERNGHVARLVIAFPLASLNRTVIQHSWNLADYPSAWPSAEDEIQQE